MKPLLKGDTFRTSGDWPSGRINGAWKADEPARRKKEAAASFICEGPTIRDDGQSEAARPVDEIAD